MSMMGLEVPTPAPQAEYKMGPVATGWWSAARRPSLASSSCDSQETDLLSESGNSSTDVPGDSSSGDEVATLLTFRPPPGLSDAVRVVRGSLRTSHKLVVLDGAERECALEEDVSEVSPPVPPASGQVPLPCRLMVAGRTETPEEELPERRRQLRDIPPHCMTLVVRNIPREYTQEDLLEDWCPDGTVDYLHLPFHSSKRRPMGYAYVNFTSHMALLAFRDRWHGRFLSKYYYRKPLDIVSADTQGFEANMLMLKGKINQLEKVGFLPLVFQGTARLETKAAYEAVFHSHA